MGIIVGEPFEDYGNTIEYTVGELRAYERLSHGRVRLYLTEERGNKHVVLYTAVVPASVLDVMGQKCMEIARDATLEWPGEKEACKTAH